jgi:hypothetical protein
MAEQFETPALSSAVGDFPSASRLALERRAGVADGIQSRHATTRHARSTLHPVLLVCAAPVACLGTQRSGRRVACNLVSR